MNGLPPVVTQDHLTLLQAVTGPGAGACAVLVLMSLFCWYLLASRLLTWIRRHRQGRQFYQVFSSLSQREDLAQLLTCAPPSPLQRLTAAAWFCWQRGLGHPQGGAGTMDQWLVASIQQQLDKERLMLESGLTLLACVGACAPFVGLFGTVWGIYHALQAIGVSGSTALDQVAGPVGEALVMTGLGLLVALPAVLAYNGLVRLNRRELAWLESFAHQLHALLVWEARLTPPLAEASGRPLPRWFVAGATV
jgi:biopolymer transport protein ExbB